MLSAALALALLGMLLLVRRMRRSERAGRRADELRRLGEALRDADDPVERAPQLQRSLAELTDAAVTLLLPDDVQGTEQASWIGEADADERAGLWLALRESQAFGPGTGRHEQQPSWYLPMRGRASRARPRTSLGAALLSPAPESASLLAHAQALCDEMGLALERAQAARSAERARDEAQGQRLRNTLLAAISHDYRTPLATIIGAASALQEQAERLSIEQRRRLAASIEREAEQLGRMTENTLQLARLDAPGLALRLDWESAEEIVGAVLRRLDRFAPRDPLRRVQARVEPALPLLRCDAVLLVQLLDNLVDNALKHAAPAEGAPAAPVEIVVRRIREQIVIAVRDRGPGVAPAWRERIFDAFQRGAAAPGRGAGVGLAVCRAIARAHGGELVYRPRGHGGASFECRLPIATAPPLEAAA